MNRRQLLKPLAALAAIPVLFKGKAVGQAFAIDPAKKYIIFANYNMVDMKGLCDTPGPFPGGTPVHAVIVPPDGTLDDAIRIYEVG